MKNNLELNMINNLIAEKHCCAQMRAEILGQLKGLKYWLYLLGL